MNKVSTGAGERRGQGYTVHEEGKVAKNAKAKAKGSIVRNSTRAEGK
jgi:hypothetical protein